MTENRRLTLRILKVRREQLMTLSKGERELFILSGHIQNELNVLNKLLTWSLARSPEASSAIAGNGKAMQGMFLARLMAGKCREAWDALSKLLFANRDQMNLFDEVPPEAVIALERLKKYFGRANIIYSVRNDFAFHYSTEALCESWESVADAGLLEVILGGTIGNNFSIGAEFVASASLLGKIDKNDIEKGLGELLQQTRDVHNLIQTVAEGVSLGLLQRMLGKDLNAQASTEEILVERTFAEIEIPYFYSIN